MNDLATNPPLITFQFARFVSAGQEVVIIAPMGTLPPFARPVALRCSEEIMPSDTPGSPIARLLSFLSQEQPAPPEEQLVPPKTAIPQSFPRQPVTFPPKNEYRPKKGKYGKR